MIRNGNTPNTIFLVDCLMKVPNAYGFLVKVVTDNISDFLL